MLALVRRTPERNAGLILLVWFALPVAVMTVVSQVVHPFYLLLTLPAGAGLAGWGAVWAFSWASKRALRRVLLATAAAVCAGFAVVQSAASLRYYAETAAIPGAHGLSALPLRDGLALGALIRDELPPGGTVLADTDEWILSSFSGLTFPFLREARQPLVTILPAAGGVLVAAQPAHAPLITPDGSTGQRALELADGVMLTVDTLPTAPAPPDDVTPLAVAGQQGIALEGYAIDELGDGQFALRTYWRVTDPALAADRLYAPFAHIFDADGRRVAVVDGQAVPAFEWAAGDLHAHRMEFEAALPFTLALGQYDGGAGENVNFTLPDGSLSALIPLPAHK